MFDAQVFTARGFSAGAILASGRSGRETTL